MAFSDGDDFVSGSIFSYQQANRMKNNFRGASKPSNLQTGMLFSDSDNDRLYHEGVAGTIDDGTGSDTEEEVLQETRSRDASPWFSNPEIKGLNIVTNMGEVVVNEGDVVFTASWF